MFTSCLPVHASPGEPLIYLFVHADGSRRSDGCVTYLQAPSVQNALLILDGAYFRHNCQVRLLQMRQLIGPCI
jgi:hypothetical protein